MSGVCSLEPDERHHHKGNVFDDMLMPTSQLVGAYARSKWKTFAKMLRIPRIHVEGTQRRSHSYSPVGVGHVLT